MCVNVLHLFRATLHLGRALQLQALVQQTSEIGINLGKVLDGTLLDELRGILQMADNVVDQTLTGRLVQHLAVEHGGLGEVVVVGGFETVDGSGTRLLGVLQLVGEHTRFRTAERVRVVVGGASLVVGAVHRTVTLVVLDRHAIRAVDRQLLVVGSEAVTMGIGVREQTTLEHLVRGWFDTGDKVRRSKRDLLDFGKVVAWVAIEDHFTDWDQRVFALGPNLGEVERIEAGLLGLLEGHHLDVQRPAGEFSLGDRVVQITDSVIRIGTGQFIGTLGVQVLDALVGLEVELAPDRIAGGVDHLEGVRSIAVHEAETVRSTTIGEQEHHLVSRFRPQRDKVPEHIRILEVSRRVTLLGVDEAREQDRVTDEEDRGVVSHQIPHAILGVELQGETARVTGRIGRTTFTAHRREAHRHRGLLADLLEHLCRAELGDVVRHLKVTERAATLGVDHTLRNALPIKVGQLVQEVHVLQQHRTALAGGHRGRLRSDRGAIARDGGVALLELGENEISKMFFFLNWHLHFYIFGFF